MSFKANVETINAALTSVTGVKYETTLDETKQKLKLQYKGRTKVNGTKDRCSLVYRPVRTLARRTLLMTMIWRICLPWIF